MKAVFRSSLLGYQKKDVNIAVAKLVRQNEEAITAIEEEIDQYIEKNRALKEEIERLHQETEEETISLDMIRFACGKVDRFLHLYEAYAHREAAKIKETEENSRQKYDDIISSINQEIRETQVHLKDFLESIIQRNETLDHGISDFSAKTSDKNEEVNVVDSSEPWLLDQLEEDLNELEIHTLDEAKNNLPGIPQTPEAAVSTKEDPYVYFVNSSDEEIGSPEIHQATAKKTHALQIGFWGDFSEEERLREEPDGLVPKVVNIAPSTAESIQVSPAPAAPSVSSEKPEETTKKGNDSKLNIASKYIVGKLAGEDLLASNGTIIVKKSEIITESMVIQAEKDGKLSELILNMTIPDMPVISA